MTADTPLEIGMTRRKIPIPSFCDNGQEKEDNYPESQRTRRGDEVLAEQRSSVGANPEESDGVVVAIKEEVESGGNSTNSRIDCSEGNSMLQDESVVSTKTVIGFVYDSDIGEGEENMDPSSQTASPLSQQNNESSRTQSGTFEEREPPVVDDPNYGTDDKTDDVLNIDKIFIQPEGDAAAEELPYDVHDETAGLAYIELPTFFETKVKELVDTKIPEAEATTRELVRKINQARNCTVVTEGKAKLNALESERWVAFNGSTKCILTFIVRRSSLTLCFLPFLFMMQ